jgi:hypothetical protein
MLFKQTLVAPDTPQCLGCVFQQLEMKKIEMLPARREET